MIGHYWNWRQAVKRAQAMARVTGRRHSVKRSYKDCGPFNFPAKCWEVREVCA